MDDRTEELLPVETLHHVLATNPGPDEWLVIRDAEAFAVLWERVGVGIEAPPVELSGGMLVCVFYCGGGRWPRRHFDGYRRDGEALEVVIRVERPAPTVMDASPGMFCALLVGRVPHAGGPVRFTEHVVRMPY